LTPLVPFDPSGSLTWYQGNIPEVIPEEKFAKFSDFRKNVVRYGEKLAEDENPRRWKFKQFNKSIGFKKGK